MKIRYILSLALAWGVAAGALGKTVDLKILQLNVWINGNNMPEGRQGLVDFIDRHHPDVVFLCELHADNPLTDLLVGELQKRGKTYHADGQKCGTGILSMYALENIAVLPPTKDGRKTVKANIRVNGREIAVYSAHLDHLNYAPYLPRGYDPNQWTKLDAPTTDSILEINRRSNRDEAIRIFLSDARAETALGRMVIIGGDFNEPSHRDWQADTKDMRDHRGAVVDWDVSLMLEGDGYIDAYRKMYPSAVTHPGFTYPAGNRDANLDKLNFAKDADERDRIDFIYYHPQPGVSLKSAAIAGPAESVVRNAIAPDNTSENFVPPVGVWITDHKGNMATFKIKATKVAAKRRNDKNNIQNKHHDAKNRM